MKIISKILKYKRAILLTVLAMICFTSIMSVGPTYAYLKIIHDDQMVDNNFDVSKQVNPSVNTDYTVNVGDNKVNADDTGYSVYVRATVVASWKKGSEVLGVFPEQGVNYSLALGSRKWVYNNADGYYYYNETVKSGDPTEPLLLGYSQIGNAPEEGYVLSVEVLTQTIQAVGKKNGTLAVTDAWGYTPPQPSNP